MGEPGAWIFRKCAADACVTSRQQDVRERLAERLSPGDGEKVRLFALAGDIEEIVVTKSIEFEQDRSSNRRVFMSGEAADRALWC